MINLPYALLGIVIYLTGCLTAGITVGGMTPQERRRFLRTILLLFVTVIAIGTGYAFAYIS